MADDTTDAAPDPASGLPSSPSGRPVSSDEVADALDEDAAIAPMVAEIVNADESTQAAVEASRRTLEVLDGEW